MATNDIYLVMGRSKNDDGEITGSDIQIAKVTIDFLQDYRNLTFNYPFVQVWKIVNSSSEPKISSSTVTIPTPSSSTSKPVVLFMYCKSTCPYTKQTFESLKNFNRDIIINLFNLSLSDDVFITESGIRVNQMTLQRVLQNFKDEMRTKGINTDYITPSTVPQFFFKQDKESSIPIGGYTTLLERLAALSSL